MASTELEEARLFAEKTCERETRRREAARRQIAVVYKDGRLRRGHSVILHPRSRLYGESLSWEHIVVANDSAPSSTQAARATRRTRAC